MKKRVTMEFEIPQIEANERTPKIDKLYQIINNLIAESLKDKDTVERLKREANGLRNTTSNSKRKNSSG